MKTSRCNSCGAEIVWARSEGGRAMPLDAEPVEGGNVELLADGTAIVLKKEEAASYLPGTLRKSHFATCPHAARHRKERQ